MRNSFAIAAMLLALSMGGSVWAAEQDAAEGIDQASLQSLSAECEKQAVELGVDDVEAFVGQCVEDKLTASETEKS